MPIGIVIKATSSFYYVNSHDKIWTCKVRGRMKQSRYSICTGDEVEFAPVGDGRGAIETVLPRRSFLQRPEVANVSQVLLTFAAKSPDVDADLIDKFLILTEWSELPAILCINKIDLADSEEIETMMNVYRKIRFETLLTSAALGLGIDELRQKLYGQVTVFAGPSGVGKSSLLNLVEPGFSLATGLISEKIGRGRHTTRLVELMPLAGGGFVVDTPGFSLTDFSTIPLTGIQSCFREFRQYVTSCRFNSCMHDKEPQCGVKQAVLDGLIASRRYQSYLTILQERRSVAKEF